jgi:hypothetical protein
MGAVTDKGTATRAHRRSVETALPQIIRTLEEVFGRQLVAHIAGAGAKTVATWIGGDHQPRSDSENQLRTAYQALQELLEGGNTEHTARSWFVGLNPQLDDIAPANALRDGQLREVLVAARSFVRGG